jgi:release factor glutamine methyltransferase
MGPHTWTIKDLLKVTSEFLGKKGIESPRLSAEILLAHQLMITRVDLYLNFDKPLERTEIAGYRALIKRRLNREPIQYITGRQEFWSMDFLVGPQALIPRPESELLVEEALRLAKERRASEHLGLKILDLGTGCGALAISIASELEEASVWASDISQDALEVARLNAKRHGVEGQIEFVWGDLWEPFKALSLTFDMIISNPPYIASDEIRSLMPEVRDHEPMLALDGGVKGINYIEKIILAGAGYLNSEGWLLVEMDPEQTPAALGLIGETGCYSEAGRVKDYSHRYRVVWARRG